MLRGKKDEERKPIEQEICELQRKFRVLENDKRASSEDNQAKIRRQRETIEKLTCENQRMKDELIEQTTTPSSQCEAKICSEKLQKLQDQKSSICSKLENETEIANSLQEKTDSTHRKINAIREEVARSGGMDNGRNVQKQIRILENRLDHATRKFNEAVTANKALRENIDTLRRERVVFDDIYRKLEEQLQQKKADMATVIEQANQAYQARDYAQEQIIALKQQADKEHAEWEKEWRELGKLLDSDKRMKDTMRVNTQEIKTTEATLDEERHRTRVNRTLQSLVTINRKQDKVAAFSDALKKIQDATGIQNIDELVRTFTDGEEQNFSLFKYNNELSAEIEKLEQQISAYKEEYKTLSSSSSRKEDSAKAKIYETLEEKCSDVEKKAKQYEGKYKDSQETLGAIRVGIENIFHKIGCSQDALPSGLDAPISESNMITYLAIIEHRTNDILKLYDLLQTPCEDEDEEDVVGERTLKSNQSLTNLNIKLPSTMEDASDEEDVEDEDEQWPFTREELKTKTIRGITKRGKRKVGSSTCQRQQLSSRLLN